LDWSVVVIEAFTGETPVTTGETPVTQMVARREAVISTPRRYAQGTARVHWRCGAWVVKER
jgi:hypothetical protein